MIVAIILFVVLIGSLFINLTQFVTHAFSGNSAFRSDGFTAIRDDGPRLDEYYVKNNHAANKIAVVTVDGIITSHTADPAGNNMVDVIQAQFDRAKKDRKVKAVILKVDSPGGEVMASDDIYRVIKKFQDDSGKPVVCSMGSLAASGGYYISSPCRWIVANELTITGSIGVIMHGYNYRGLMDKVGLAPMTFKSGKFKDMLSGERETNEIPAGEQAMVQGLIDETYATFTNVVSTGRGFAHGKNNADGRALAADWASYADGRVLSGKQALNLGFVDELGNFEDAVSRTKQLAQTGDANLIEYRERYDFSDFLSMFARAARRTPSSWTSVWTFRNCAKAACIFSGRRRKTE